MKLILVTGCPRSGTTAVASWLLSAPGVAGGMETRRSVVVHAMLNEARRFRTFGDDGLAGAGATRDVLVAAARAALESLYGNIPTVAFSANEATVVDKEPLEPIALPKGDYAQYLQDVLDVTDGKLICLVRNPIDAVASMVRRKWGYSTYAEPRAMTAELGAHVWNAANAAIIRAAVVAPERVSLHSHEALCSDPRTESEILRQVTGLALPDFKPMATHHGEYDARVVSETSWIRQLLGCYDDRKKVAPRIVLLTGEPGTGKSTLARAAQSMCRSDERVVVLDGDDMRTLLWPELGYDDASRAEAVRRAGNLAVSVAAAGALVLVAMVAPAEGPRRKMGEAAAKAGVTFRVVRATAPREVRIQRRTEDVHGFAYEEPSAPNLVVDTTTVGVEDATRSVLEMA